jgi:hypothetical protein
MRGSQNAAMLISEKLELAGPVVVVAAIAAVELGAYSLAASPASSFLWYLNLEVFRCFQYALSGLGGVRSLDVLHLTALIAVTLMVLVGTSLVADAKLPLAIACNFSFLYSLCLWCGSYLANANTRTVDPDLSVLLAPSSLLAAALALLTLCSAVLSHRRYWREIFPADGAWTTASTPLS